MIICDEFGGSKNIATCNFILDSEDELQFLPTTEKMGSGKFEDFTHHAPIGSTAIVGNDGGELLVFQLYSFGWKKIS